METKRNIFLWTTYDFANSIVMIVFFLYFAQWIVVERGISDFHFNLTFTCSAILLLLTVPFTGSLLDHHLRRITGLRYSTLFTALFYGICAVCAVKNLDSAALIFFTLGLYAYLLSFTFYTPLLSDIAPVEKRGLISGIGIAANYAGQFAGLLLALPFSTGFFSLFGASARAETLLPSVVIFFVLSLPMLVFFKEPKHKPRKFNTTVELKHLASKTKELLSRNMVFFFLAFFLFNDAVLTAANNFPIFLEQVWGFSDTVKTYLMLGTLITSGIGGFVSGFLADRWGHKRTLMFILLGWVVIFPLLALLRNFAFFVGAVVFMGFWYGANWAVSRSTMSHIAPKGGHNLAFAYYGLTERASALLGPIIWGLVVSGLTSMGSDRYRIGMLAITGFIGLGAWALSKVNEKQ